MSDSLVGDSSRVPSGTTLRFATVVTLVLATALFAFTALVGTERSGTAIKQARCEVSSGFYQSATTGVDPDESKWDRLRACRYDEVPTYLTWAALGLLLLLAMSAAVYWLGPRWRVRRARLVPIDAAHLPELHARLSPRLDALAARAGTVAPRFLLDPANRRAGGSAFGTGGRAMVCLDAGLVTLADRTPAAFDAVVLHELAHVRNRDVSTAYLTRALWRSFLLVILIPFVATQLYPPLYLDIPWTAPALPGAVGWGLIWRALALTALVFLATRSVLRARELYADARVAEWTGSTDPYADLRRHSQVRVWAWLANHPSGATRRRVLEEPDALRLPGFWETFAAAAALHLAWSHLTAALGAIGASPSYDWSDEVLRVLWSASIGLLIGITAWRGADHLRAGGRIRTALVLPGLAVAAGVAVGARLDLRQAGAPVTMPSLYQWVLALLLAAGCVLISLWVAMVANRAGWLAVAAAAVLCLVYLSWWPNFNQVEALWHGQIVPGLSGLGAGLTPVDQVLGPVTLLALPLEPFRTWGVVGAVVLWLVPLLSGRTAGVRSALATGAVGAGVWLLLDIVLRGLAHVTVPAATRIGDDFAVAFAVDELWLALLVELAGAVGVTRRFGATAALLAAATTGLGAGLGLWLLHALDGCGPLWSVSSTGCAASVDVVLAARPQQVLWLLGPLVVLLGVTLARLRPRAPAPPDAPARWGVRIAVGVAVLTVFTGLWWPTARREIALFPATPPLSVDLDAAMRVWVFGGGFDTFMAMANERTAIVEQPFDPTRALAECGKTVELVGQARTLGPPPDPRTAADWAAMLDATDAMARECVRSLGEGDMVSSAMLDSFTDSLTHAGAVLKRINEVVPSR